MCVQMREARVLRTGMGDPGWLENTGHGNNYVRDYAVRSHGIKSCNHVVVWHERALGVSRRSHCFSTLCCAQLARTSCLFAPSTGDQRAGVSFAEGMAAESERERERERGALYSALREESGGRGLNRQREMRPHHLDAQFY